MRVEFQFVEPFLESYDWHLNQVRNTPPSDLHILGFWLQTGTVTFRTVRLTSIARQHHTILDLILILLQHLEELIDARFLLRTFIRRQPVPKPVFLTLGKIHIGFEDGEVVVSCVTDEPLLPFLHLFPVPADDTAIVDGECRIGDYQFLVDADDSAEALTFWTGSSGRIEGEHLVAGFFKRHPVGLEVHREIVEDSWREQQTQFSMPLEEGCLSRIHQTGDRVLRVVYRQTVDDKESLPLSTSKGRGDLSIGKLLQIVVDSDKIRIGK